MVELHHGDCLEILQTLEENSVDTVVLLLDGVLLYSCLRLSGEIAQAEEDAHGVDKARRS